MLRTIEVENLKCFKHQLIELSNLTLLTGFNAAGKSTFIQSILLANQLVRSRNGCSSVALNGPVVKLGTSGELLNEASNTKRVNISFESESGCLNLELDASERNSPSINLINNKEFFKNKTSLKYTLRDVVYIGAIRLGTHDVFPAPEDAEPIYADVGCNGQFAPWWFERYMDEDIVAEKKHHSETASTLRRQFNAWAGDIFPGSQANAIQLLKTSLVQLELRTRETEGWRRPANIGYGLTYAFPIIVAGLLARPGQILIVDSPEAHLHPLGQSKIGEFLAVMASSGVQVILETHSDHVLNGIRLAVARQKIEHNNVAINFFSTTEHNGKHVHLVTAPKIDVNGNLSEWPSGFFDQFERDISALAGWE